MFDYMVCDSASLPVIIIRGNTVFGETVRTALPSLKKTDNQDLSCHIFDPFSPGACVTAERSPLLSSIASYSQMLYYHSWFTRFMLLMCVCFSFKLSNPVIFML